MSFQERLCAMLVEKTTTFQLLLVSPNKSLSACGEDDIPQLPSFLNDVVIYGLPVTVQ